MKKNLFVFVIGMLLYTAASIGPAFSQCSMCRAVAASGAQGAQEEGQKIGRGLNNGILYLLATPYLIGGVAFLVWRKHRKRPGSES